MPNDSDQLQRDIAAMQQRLDLLERDNERLRAKLEPMMGKDNPSFDPVRFMSALRWIQIPLMLPIWILPAILLPLLMIPSSPLRPLTRTRIGPVPVVDVMGSGSGIHGMGLGIVAFGGGALGVFAMGGAAIGIIALGGGAAGVIALGGGSVGLIAIGGGACGYIAIGGSACGYYALGQRAYGRYGLGLNRQDPEAIEFFVRWFPRLRSAVTTPMPVLPLKTPTTDAHAG